MQVPEDKWQSIIVSYDNMCQLDGMKAAKAPLPLPPPYNEMWLKVQKVRTAQMVDMCLKTIIIKYSTTNSYVTRC